MLHIKPKAGTRVPDPSTGRPLPADGAKVGDTQYWRRRLKDGDVVKVQRSTKGGQQVRKQKDEEKPA